MTFHLFHIRELYSNADGSVQYIEFVGDADDQGFWAGHSLTSTDGAVTKTFDFPSDLPSGTTSGRSVLVATQGFADLGLVTPDYIVPNGFLFTAGGTVAVAGMDSVTHGALPTGGTQSVDDNGIVGVNSPTNFGGDSVPIPGNPIVGTPGANTLNGTAGADYIVALAGNDSLSGGAGIDTMVGGSGNDRYVVDDFSDVTIETGSLASEIDTVFSSVSRYIGANLERLTLTGTASINGNGNRLDNVINGNAGANHLRGGAGDDTLRGGAGADFIEGDNGNDRLDGGTGDDGLYGGLGNDSLASGEGSDVLSGAAGNDTMVGGTGNDSYFVADASDVVVEIETSASEIDGVMALIDYTLGANLENLTLFGPSVVRGSGNALPNSIVGNGIANSLGGGGGNDTILGWQGNDTINGGNGNDSLTGGIGADDFRFSTTLNAAANVDRLADFVAPDDRISLDDAAFAGIGAIGALAPAAFRAGAAAADTSDRVVYDSATGRLLYDADGSGASAALLFATVAPGTTITAADFFVI